MARRFRIPRPRPLELGRRLVDLLGPTGDAARQSLVALGFNSCTSFAAGAVLGSITHTFEELPGLLVMVPAAIGLRGNIFGAVGNRISTAIHTGTFRVSFRRESVLFQNVLASLSLTFILSLVLALIAKVVAIAFDIQNTIGVLDLALISIVGGVIASLVVLAATVVLSIGAVRREWDLDNLVAPTVSTLGDVVTIPALFLASKLLGHGSWTTSASWVMVVVTLGVIATSLRTHLPLFRQILRESMPVLVVALLLSTLAGIAVEKQLTLFAALPALLVLQPAFVSSAGALGGILSSRVATNLHLGLVQPEMRPGREARRDALLVLLIGFPVFVFNGVGAHFVGRVLDEASPGLGWMVLASLIGGLFAVLFVIGLAYYGTIAAWRMDVDPDTYGIPVVTASVDFVGVLALIFTLFALGIA
ncbi:MAG: magnesium transporter [Microthrixaceae bacterium]